MSTTCELLGVMRVPIRNITSVATTKLSILTMKSTFGLEDKCYLAQFLLYLSYY